MAADVGFWTRRPGLGYIPDPLDRRDWEFDKLGLGSTSNLDQASLEGHVPIVLNQGSTSSCVMQTFGSAIHIMESRAGLPFMPVSMRFGYYNSRRMHGAHNRDSGTHLRSCAKAMDRFGLADDKYWKWSSSRFAINKRPSFAAYMRAHPRRGGKYVKIFDYGQRRIEAICTAISEGYPVGFGTALERSFQTSRGAEFINRPAKSAKLIGRHAMLIVGYKYANDQIWFRVLNSWGTGWRDGGYCWLPSNYITWEKTLDLHIIYGWKRLQDKLAT